jgi:hypothetical protein
MRAVPRLCELYRDICLTAEEKHGRTSGRVLEKYPDISVAAVRYTFTHKQHTEQHSATEYTERKIHDNMNKCGKVNGPHVKKMAVSGIRNHLTVNFYNIRMNCSFWRCDPTRAMASSLLRFLDHTQRRITLGKTPLDK